MISLMREIDKRLYEGVTSRRDLLAGGITGTALFAITPLATAALSIDPDARLRAIVKTYGGEFGPARTGGVNHGRL